MNQYYYISISSHISQEKYPSVPKLTGYYEVLDWC